MSGRLRTSRSDPRKSCSGCRDGTVADLTAALLAVDPATARATKELLAQAQRNTLLQQAAAERQAQAALLRSRLRDGGTEP